MTRFRRWFNRFSKSRFYHIPHLWWHYEVEPRIPRLHKRLSGIYIWLGGEIYYGENGKK